MGMRIHMRHIDRNGNRSVPTTVLLPEPLHQAAKERGLCFSAILREELTRQLNAPEVKG